MAIRFTRRRTLPDGRVETFAPKRQDGYFVMADRAVSAQHNLEINQFFVKDAAAVAARLRRGGVSLRMCGDITGQQNLISASRIEIADDEAQRSDADGDPFTAFSEWSEPADEEAWRDL